MATLDRPHLSMQQRVLELLAEAEEHNAAVTLVSAVDWYILQQCTKPSQLNRDPDGKSIIIHGRKFRMKAPTKAPHGTLDMTGAEPSFEP